MMALSLSASSLPMRPGHQYQGSSLFPKYHLEYYYVWNPVCRNLLYSLAGDHAVDVKVPFGGVRGGSASITSLDYQSFLDVSYRR
jgi:hypothetical protein